MDRCFDTTYDVKAYNDLCSKDCTLMWFSPDGNYASASWHTYDKSRLAALLPDGVTPEGYCRCECSILLGDDLVYLAYCKGDKLYVLVPDDFPEYEVFDVYFDMDNFRDCLSSYDPCDYTVTKNI